MKRVSSPIPHSEMSRCSSLQSSVSRLAKHRSSSPVHPRITSVVTDCSRRKSISKPAAVMEVQCARSSAVSEPLSRVAASQSALRSPSRMVRFSDRSSVVTRVCPIASRPSEPTAHRDPATSSTVIPRAPRSSALSPADDVPSFCDSVNERSSEHPARALSPLSVTWMQLSSDSFSMVSRHVSAIARSTTSCRNGTLSSSSVSTPEAHALTMCTKPSDENRRHPLRSRWRSDRHPTPEDSEIAPASVSSSQNARLRHSIGRAYVARYSRERSVILVHAALRYSKLRQFCTSSFIAASVTRVHPARFTSWRLEHSESAKHACCPTRLHPCRLMFVTTGRYFATRRPITSSVVCAWRSLKLTADQRVGSCTTSYHPRHVWAHRHRSSTARYAKM
mmetsp:Transcript_22170/g.66633  ORF Transcript_22170/g.66633 Transcript_22170/m.66633 type:complete len:392 (+) Transcript_22170:408-1583(+)